MLFGLMLVEETKFNVMFFLQGPSGTGKSVFLHVLQHMIGLHNICSVPLEKFGDEKYSYQLTESLVNIVCDMEDASSKGYRDFEGIMKKASDGELLDIRKLYTLGTKKNVTARNVFSCNELPRIHDRSNALWRRLRVIPFETVFSDTTADDPDLRDKIVKAELSGVFLWALQGLGRLQDLRHFPEHSAGAAKKLEHRSECDVEGTYLQEHYTATEIWHGKERPLDPERYRISCKELNEHYSAWAAENNNGRLSAVNLNRAIKRVFGLKKGWFRDNANGGKPTRGFLGLARLDLGQVVCTGDLFLNQNKEAI
jgi:putative DNA primase/helicase